MQLIGYPKCSTCREVEALLREAGVNYTYRDIKTDTPSAREIEDIHRKSGLDIGRLFNTSGISYREGNWKERRLSMTPKACYEALSADGMLLKRPILIDGDDVYIGADVRRALASGSIRP